MFSIPNALKAHALHHTGLKDKCRGIFWGLELSVAGSYTVQQLRSKRERQGVWRWIHQLLSAAENCRIIGAQLMQSYVLICSDNWFSSANPLMCLHVYADAVRASNQSPFYSGNLFPVIPCR